MNRIPFIASDISGATQLLAWSTLSLDNLDGQVQSGGPCTYGGAVLEGMLARYKLQYRQVINMHPRDKDSMPAQLRPRAIIYPVPYSVHFHITRCGGHRSVRLVSESFRVDGDRVTPLREHLNVPVVILSPIIGEFGAEVIMAVARAACKTVFVDPFNNDDGLLSAWDFEVLEHIIQNLCRTKKVFLKLSEPEYMAAASMLSHFGTTTNLLLLVTRGEAGADLICDDYAIHSPGIQVDVKAELGAGDVFLYSFAGLYALGWSAETCLNEANRLAASSVTVASWEDLLHVVSN